MKGVRVTPCARCLDGLFTFGWLCPFHAGTHHGANKPEAVEALRHALRVRWPVHLCMGDVRKALERLTGERLPRNVFCPPCGVRYAWLGDVARQAAAIGVPFFPVVRNGRTGVRPEVQLEDPLDKQALEGTL